MMVVSLKANRKRIIAFLALVVIVVGVCVFLWKGKGEEAPQEIPGGTGEERVAFLTSFGWQVDAEPAETREVMIPAEFNDVYTTYNVMQKAQGFDLKPYAGETCTQYKYKINNYPNEPEVYATLLVRAGIIIGGDVACSEVNGFMHGFAPDSARYGQTEESGSASSQTESSAAVSSAPESAVSSAVESAPAESTAAESGVVSGASSAMETVTESAQESSAVESTAGEPIPEEAFPTD